MMIRSAAWLLRTRGRQQKIHPDLGGGGGGGGQGRGRERTWSISPSEDAPAITSRYRQRRPSGTLRAHFLPAGARSR